MDNKSIGYLDTFLADNAGMKYQEYSKRLAQAWKACDGAPKSQTQLAKWLGFAQPTVNNWINGNALPGLETAVNLADKFGCNPIWLITGNGNKEMDKAEVLPSSPLFDKFDQLSANQQREVSEFINFKLSQNKGNKDGSVRIKKETRPPPQESGYIEMIKNKCKENQCYCEIPCNSSPQEKRGVFTDFKKAVAKIRNEQG